MLLLCRLTLSGRSFSDSPGLSARTRIAAPPRWLHSLRSAMQRWASA